MHLFIDTTQKITIGLIGADFKWHDYIFDPKIVISTKLHLMIYEMLEKHNLSINEIESLIYVAGPGSYTGMRVSEGFAQILAWQKFKYYSFYHFEVPQLAGESKGIWFDDAFKKEYFLYEWDGNASETKLIPHYQLDENLKDKRVFSQYSEVDNISSTTDLIKDHSELIFSNVVNQSLQRELYYYRSLEKEFQKC